MESRGTEKRGREKSKRREHSRVEDRPDDRARRGQPRFGSCQARGGGEARGSGQEWLLDRNVRPLDLGAPLHRA